MGPSLFQHPSRPAASPARAADQARNGFPPLRESDTIYRYGGEEFLALLPAQDGVGAGIAAERLRRAVSALALPHPAGGVVTISGGVAVLGPAETSAQLLERADEALYEAKQAGRDCLRMVPDGLVSSGL